MKRIILLLLMIPLVAISATGQVTYSASLHNDAQAGNTQAMADLGFCYAYGKGVKKDVKKAEELYNKAIAKGNTDAMRRLGYLYNDGDGDVPLDYNKALEWYTKAANQGDSEAMYKIGLLYQEGASYHTGEVVVKRNPAKALEWYQKAIQKDNASAMNALGAMYTHGDGVEQDYATALEWFRKAANRGEPNALYNIGVFYENGYGVTKDDSKAIEWYKKAAQQKNTSAMYSLAIMYFLGRGVEKNVNSALDWLVKRIEIIDDEVYNAIAAFQIVLRNENQKGEYNSRLSSYKELFNLYKNTYDSNTMSSQDLFYGLAVFYALGVGTEPNKAKAEEFIEELRACDAYHVCRAAEFYEFGDLGAIDYKRALEIYEECTWDVYSPAKAASFYIDGKGTTKNIPRALELINQSKEYAEFAETTSPLADYLLGQLYYYGTGVKQNRAEAFKLFKAAAEDEENPDDEAMNMLSTCYRFGYGTTKDLKKAEYWLMKAEETGNDKARRIKHLLGH